jgi:hypothetical protein
MNNTENSRNEVARIALVDPHCAWTKALSVLYSTHERMTSALAANLEFQRREPATRNDENLTLSRRLHEGETVRSAGCRQNP